MTDYRMSDACLQGQADHLREVVLRQFHLAVEDQSQVILRIDRWLCLWTMTLEAEGISFGAQKLGMITPVRIMAGRASLLERRLMQNLLAVEFRLIGVAGQTDVDRIRL